MGDHFLAAIGERMRGVLRDEDFVARIGGDEFVALSSPLRSGVRILPPCCARAFRPP
ncbi:diguanylate cyclase domain-containing protein [Rudaea cellulosilytica]|uniref:diguanylate cyclase domain-containing protein n=1 Tax=Rudaea cellulosilytica TaxID=540746 RepID=UPI002480E092|nr:diguanylate cyclase [Rudaea cellulosilytica]